MVVASRNAVVPRARVPATQVSRADRIPLALIDDHQLVRQSLSVWLAVEGPDIDVVASVRTVAELRATPGWGAPVVVLDLGLDDHSTVEENVAELRAGGSRVVVISASAEPATVHRAVCAGALSYVPKSASAEEMLSAIRATAVGSAFMTQDLATALLEYSPIARPKLSPQELRTLQWYAGGMPMKSVAMRLGISEGCVKSYVDRIREKYDRIGRQAPTKIDLYRRAVEDGYLP